MSTENKRKGRKTITRRQYEDESYEIGSTAKEDLQELFAMFYRAKETEGVRPRTLQDHKTHFRYFSDYLKQRFSKVKHGNDITADIIRSYIHYLKNEKGMWDNHDWLAVKYSEKKGLSPVTINVRLRSLKCFFRFLYLEGYIKNNPTERIKLLKTEDDTIESFSAEQIKILLRQPNQKTYTGYRDYVLMMLFLDTGIRVSEALGLKTENFNAEQKTITVPANIAKNGKSRILPLTKTTAKIIKTLLQDNQGFEEHEDRILLTNYGQKLEASVVRARFAEYGHKAEITDIRVSPHTFRHTFAKFYILNGGDAFTLQRLLDHSTMNMVRKYIQMNHQDIKIQHNQFSPINNLAK